MSLQQDLRALIDLTRQTLGPSGKNAQAEASEVVAFSERVSLCEPLGASATMTLISLDPRNTVRGWTSPDHQEGQVTDVSRADGMSPRDRIRTPPVFTGSHSRSATLGLDRTSTMRSYTFLSVLPRRMWEAPRLHASSSTRLASKMMARQRGLLEPKSE